MGLAWGILTFPGSEAADEFLDLEGRLLRFETFSRAMAEPTLASESAQSALLSIRALLQTKIEQLELTRRKGFSEALQKSRSL